MRRCSKAISYLPTYILWEAVMRISPISQAVRCGALHPTLSEQLQNLKPRGFSLEVAPQQQGAPQLVWQPSVPFCFGGVLHSVWNKDLGVGTFSYSSFLNLKVVHCTFTGQNTQVLALACVCTWQSPSFSCLQNTKTLWSTPGSVCGMRRSKR